MGLIVSAEYEMVSEVSIGKPILIKLVLLFLELDSRRKVERTSNKRLISPWRNYQSLLNELIYHRNLEDVCRGRWLQICACATSGMCRSSNNNRMSNLVYLPFCAKIAAIPQAEKLQLLCKWKDHPERTFFKKLDKFLPLKVGTSLSFSG